MFINVKSLQDKKETLTTIPMTSTSHFSNRVRTTVLAAIMLTCLAVFPTGMSAQNLDFKVNDVPVREAVLSLQKQSGYSMSISADELDMSRHVSVNAKDKSPLEIIRMIFKGQDVNCSANGKTLTVSLAKKNKNQKAAKAAGQKKVTGTISDTQLKEPLIGATVTNTATGQAVVTDADGRYSIAAEPGQTLEVSYVGFTPSKVKVGNGSELDVAMDE